LKSRLPETRFGGRLWTRNAEGSVNNRRSWAESRRRAEEKGKPARAVSDERHEQAGRGSRRKKTKDPAANGTGGAGSDHAGSDNWGASIKKNEERGSVSSIGISIAKRKKDRDRGWSVSNVGNAGGKKKRKREAGSVLRSCRPRRERNDQQTSVNVK